MKKYSITSHLGERTFRGKNMQEAIEFKNTLPSYAIWTIKEVLQVRLGKKYSKVNKQNKKVRA